MNRKIRCVRRTKIGFANIPGSWFRVKCDSHRGFFFRRPPAAPFPRRKGPGMRSRRVPAVRVNAVSAGKKRSHGQEHWFPRHSENIYWRETARTLALTGTNISSGKGHLFSVTHFCSRDFDRVNFDPDTFVSLGELRNFGDQTSVNLN